MPSHFSNILRRTLTLLVAGLGLGGLALPLPGQTHEMEKARDGLFEAGAPMFEVLSKEALGLNSPPTDLQIMPDGRVLVVAGVQLALGDGVRWEVFNQAHDGQPARSLTVAVDEDGTIYQAIPGGFAKVVFGTDGKWTLQTVASWPSDETQDHPVPRFVITVGPRWFWHSNSGSIISWRPGQTAVTVGQADAVTQILKFRDDYFLSDQSDGTIHRLSQTGGKSMLTREKVLSDGLITCSLPLDDNFTMIGTSAHGVCWFNGHESTPFITQGVLAGGQRINDLCEVAKGYYAAAVENHGVVFFNQQGRTVQSLDRTSDHRLSHIVRLVAGRGATVWGLLNDSVFRVEFPSRVSHFEPYISTGLTSAHPSRLKGELWLATDNRVLKAIYDPSGRLTKLEPDTPEGQIIFTMSSAPGVPVASTEESSFYRDASGWKLLAENSPNFRILHTTPIDGRWLYTVRDAIGWLSWSDGVLKTETYPAPGMGRVYDSNTDEKGIIWLERGSGLLGRIFPSQPGKGAPKVELFGEHEGVPQGWAQVFVIDGVARFNIADRILRFDETTGKFVTDEAFAREFAGLGTIVGRPGRDARGRLWLTTEQGIHLFKGELGKLQPVAETMPAGFQPYFFTFENGGVVWMHASRRLARYDPDVPIPPAEPLSVLITHVTFPGSARTLFPQNGTLPDLSFTDNTLIPHFVSPSNPFTSSVTFEVMLEGAGQDWVSSGSTGSTVFNQLKEGSYVLLVRPVAHGTSGKIAKLSFTINPPWYRTKSAYVAALLLIFGGIYGISRLVIFLERREKKLLEDLVARRTRELNDTNSQLAAQVEEIRTLSQAIQQSPVGVIILNPDGTIAFANPRVCELSGYDAAELTGKPSGLLRLPETDATLLSELDAALHRGDSWQGQLTNRSKSGRTFHVHTTASPLRNANGTIHHHLLLEEDITEWLADQGRSHRLEAQLFQAQKNESLGTLAGGIAHDFNNILTGILGYCELSQLKLGDDSAVQQELAAIRTAGHRAKDLVNQILTFSRRSNTPLKPLDLSRPVTEALKLVRASTPTTIEINQEIQPGMVNADPTQIHQIMLNLCTNAAHAMPDRPGRLTVRLEPVTLGATQAAEIPGLEAGEHIRLSVTDTGDGMSPAMLSRIFDPFFTTKEPGVGTGLGLSIVQGIVTSHKGGLLVRSKPGTGTTFELFFPVSRETHDVTTPPMPAPQGNEQEIIIIDDEPMITSFVSVRLKQLGYRAMAFNDPRAGLEAITSGPGRFTAIITDLTMPHMTGVELIRRLNELGINLPTLIITGYNLNASRADLATLPHCLVLQKPFTGEELAQALHRVIANPRPRGSPPAPPPNAP